MLKLIESVKQEENHSYFASKYENLTLDLWEVLNNISVRGTCNKIKGLVESVDNLVRDNDDVLKHVKIIDNYYDRKDVSTYPHFVSTCCLAVWFASRLNLDRDTVLLIGMGAILHDVGKLGVPKRILEKPEKLDKDEMAEIRKHPIYGYRFMSKAADTFPEEVMETILFHHERPNGTGYPYSIKGGRFGLPTKIVAIMDCFDAMTSSRAYCKPKSIIESVDELTKLGDEHFNFSLNSLFCFYMREMYLKWTVQATSK